MQLGSGNGGIYLTISLILSSSLLQSRFHPDFALVVFGGYFSNRRSFIYRITFLALLYIAIALNVSHVLLFLDLSSAMPR